MQAGSLYNLIESIEPTELKRDNLKNSGFIIRVCDSARKVLDSGLKLASEWKTDKVSSLFHGYNLSLLVLACKTYRSIPNNLEQYLFYRQETMSQARWMTTASGYLRILHFNIVPLDETQIATLLNIVGYLVNVYVLTFVQINLHPSVASAPEIVLLTRDLMKDYGVPEKVKTIFLDHAERWLSPINVAVVVHQENPPITVDDLDVSEFLT